MTPAPTPAQEKKSAIIIGAGIGGLALGIRLQSAGIATTIVEGKERAGGGAGIFVRDGFTFDTGPSTLTSPDSFAELWRLTGQDMAQDVALCPVAPHLRLMWPDGTQFDISADDTAIKQEIARLDSSDLAGYERFTNYSTEALRGLNRQWTATSFTDFPSMAKMLPTLMQMQSWRSVYGLVSSTVRNEYLRQALSFQTLLYGGNPLTTPAWHAAGWRLEQESGLWAVRGGTHRLIAAMITQFERIGGTMRLGDPVVRLDTIGDRITAVVTQDGWHGEADTIASTVDLMRLYSELLASHPRGAKQAEALSRKHWSPSAFTLFFGMRGTWPGIAHRMFLPGPRFTGLMTDIFQHGLLSADMAIFLDHPTVTDPSLAPEGCSVFRATVPVPHMGKLPIDWQEQGPLYAERILQEIGHRLIPDIEERIITRFHLAPPDYAADFGLWRGSLNSLEPALSQSGWMRPHNRDDVIPNLYLAGAGTHPGAGIPAVLAGARITAQMIQKDIL
ncbi:MAG: phytoene desaturase [Sphingobium sp.]|nr:phytoene desaturase [Sphingobium sp.]